MVLFQNAVGTILVEGPNRLTNFWKRTIQWLFHQNFVLIEQIVSDKKIFMWISHRVLYNDELFNIYYRIFYELWTFADFDWLCKLEKGGMKFKKNLLLGNYWSNLNQTLLKGTIHARFGLIWFSGFRGEDLNVIFYQNMPNLHNRYISAERKILQIHDGCCY
jgi:hypothetical protein